MDRIQLYYISYERVVYRLDDVWYYFMIVIYKETIEDKNIPLDMPVMECISVIEVGRIENEVRRLIELYGMERERIKGKYNDDVCLVYDDVKWYVMKV